MVVPLLCYYAVIIKCNGNMSGLCCSFHIYLQNSRCAFRLLEDALYPWKTFGWNQLTIKRSIFFLLSKEAYFENL